MQTTLPPTKYSTKTSEWRSQVPCSVWAGHIKHKPGSVSLNNTASDKKNTRANNDRNSTSDVAVFRGQNHLLNSMPPTHLKFRTNCLK